MGPGMPTRAQSTAVWTAACSERGGVLTVVILFRAAPGHRRAVQPVRTSIGPCSCRWRERPPVRWGRRLLAPARRSSGGRDRAGGGVSRASSPVTIRARFSCRKVARTMVGPGRASRRARTSGVIGSVPVTNRSRSSSQTTNGSVLTATRGWATRGVRQPGRGARSLALGHSQRAASNAVRVFPAFDGPTTNTSRPGANAARSRPSTSALVRAT